MLVCFLKKDGKCERGAGRKWKGFGGDITIRIYCTAKSIFNVKKKQERQERNQVLKQQSL